jgi:hypothetical protein
MQSTVGTVQSALTPSFSCESSYPDQLVEVQPGDGVGGSVVVVVVVDVVVVDVVVVGAGVPASTTFN